MHPPFRNKRHDYIRPGNANSCPQEKPQTTVYLRTDPYDIFSAIPLCQFMIENPCTNRPSGRCWLIAAKAPIRATRFLLFPEKAFFCLIPPLHQINFRASSGSDSIISANFWYAARLKAQLIGSTPSTHPFSYSTMPVQPPPQ